MSRAFVTENDDWKFCIQKKDTCMFADETGKCVLKICIKEKSLSNRKRRSWIMIKKAVEINLTIF